MNKCIYYELGQRKDKELFEIIKNYPENPLYKCAMCKGYTEGCEEFEEVQDKYWNSWNWELD